jgi:CBS domain containing-hemolysin-like protein
MAHLIEPPMAYVVGQFAPAASHGVALALTFAIITSLHIVLGEQVPKLIGLQRAEGTMLLAARPMVLLNVLFRWPIAFLNNVGNGVLRIIGLEPGAGREMVHSVEELRLLVAGSQQAGEVEESEARIASRAFVFADLTAGALMTPRTEVEAIPSEAGLSDVLSHAANSRHSRLPVYEETIDNVVGVLHVYDLFGVFDQPAETFSLAKLVRPVLVVPASKKADDLLEQMRAERRQLAVVIDEYGGTAGIVTIEDLVEALVGPIEDEPPSAEETAASPPLEVDGSQVIDGMMRLGEWEELTGLRLEESDHEDAETVGGLVMARLGRIPKPGDEVVVAGRTLRVEELDGKRVAAVRLLA